MASNRRFQAHEVKQEEMPSKRYALLIGIIIFGLVFAFLVAVITGTPPT